MRIWIVNHYASPPTQPGGTRHYALAQQLIKRGHEVTLIASSYNHFSHEHLKLRLEWGEVDHRFEVPFIWIPTPSYKGNTFARFNNMISFSVRLLRQKYLPVKTPPDIIIGSSPHLFAALGASLLARQLKVPFLLEIRDLWPESLIDLGRLSRYHPIILLMKKIETILYKRAQRIISLLPAANDYLMQHGVLPENILWLPNSVDFNHIQVCPPSVPSKKFTIMYAGAHGLANDLETVLHSAAILQANQYTNNIRIVLIGDGPEKKRLQALSLKLGLTNLEFQEPVPKNQIYQRLAEADAYLMLLKDSPVFRFGISPNKLFDYLAMSKPIIFGVNTPYNPIELSQAGLSVKPSDPSALATAMQQLSLLSKDQLQQMGLRGKHFVTENHHLDTLTDSLEQLMLSVVG